MFGIQRFSIHDGPGIRTTVFLKGCNMRCSWCHNPESYRPMPVLAYNPALCVGCRACEAACPRGVHHFDDGTHALHRAACVACGRCTAACPGKALEIIGSVTTPDAVKCEILKDRRYYKTSGGGVTLSGGEALLQEDFAKALLGRCKGEGIHTVIETNGSLPFERYEAVMPLVDLFLMDYKLTDEEAHRRHTGLGRAAILENIGRLHDAGANMLLRCPIIPGVNDDDAHFDAIKALRDMYPSIRSTEIMAYHDIGKTKWKALGMDYSFPDLPSASPEQKRKWEKKVEIE